MKSEDIKRLDEKLKKSDNVKIEYMKVYPVPQHQLTKERADKIKEDWIGDSRPSEKGSTTLKSLEFLTDSYPSIKIDDLDMCSNMDETVQLSMNFCFYITKKKLFELMAVLHGVDMLWCDDNFPLRVKMSCEPDINGFHWKKKVDDVKKDEKK